MAFPEFYIVQEDVFRLGNGTSARMSHLRAQDIDTHVVNGITIVISNHKGISLLTKDRLDKLPATGTWVWKFVNGLHLPTGLKLVQDKLDHYSVAPTENMPLDRYKGLLEKLGMRAIRVYKK